MENIWWMALVGGAACGVLVLAYYESYEVEVIGNVYDNPELLEAT